MQKAASDLVAAPTLVALNRNVDDVKGKASKYTLLHETGAATTCLRGHSTDLIFRAVDPVVSSAGGSKQDRVDNAQDMTNYYYDLVTDFYEYGW